VASGRPPEAEPDELAAALSRGVTVDLIEARRVIQLEIARLAAVRRTDEDVAALESVIRAHRRAIRAHRSPLAESIRFDMALAAAAHNDILAATLRSFSRLIWRQAEHMLATLEDFWQTDVEEHAAILAAVKAGDGQRAAAAMDAHLGDVQTAYRLVGEA